MLLKEKYDEIMDRIRTSIGEEASALISEDLTTLISDYTSVIADMTDRDSTIEKLKKEKDELIAVNGRLFLKVGSSEATVTTVQDIEEPETEPITDETIFDEKGEFING